MKEKKSKEWIIEHAVGLFLLLVLVAWSLVQPLTEQPDEHCRFMLPYYIMTKGRLPIGTDPELMVGYYGISYGFFPCLPYIFMAGAMKIVSLFSTSSYALLMGARMVNVVAGVLTYAFVRKLSKKLFNNRWLGWLFTLTVSFWPQVLFIFTYVNCDAFAFLSVAIMVYALVSGMQEGWDFCNFAMLSVGVSVCLLSYYNAYGVIVGVAIAFLFSFAREEKNTDKYDIKSCFKIGGITVLLVIALSGWWFIRNAILYGGDLFGMRANAALAEEYAISIYKPSTKVTLQNSGNPIWCLLLDPDFRFLIKQSFFARFGNMTILAPNYIIRGFKILLVTGVIGLVLPGKNHVLKGARRVGFDTGMITSVIITAFLVYWYSYANDYQPQGRYLLPGLIPLLAITFMGISAMLTWFDKLKWKERAVGTVLSRVLIVGAYAYIAASTLGCVYIIWRQYAGALEETMSLIFPLIG